MQIPGQPRVSVADQFGRKLREAREGKALSQRAVSERLRDLGVQLDHTAIARIELGKREPKLSEAVALSAVCGLDLDTFSRSPASEAAAAQVFVRDVLTSARADLVLALGALVSILETPTDIDGYFSFEEATGAKTPESAALMAIDMAAESIRERTTLTVSAKPSQQHYLDQAVAVLVADLVTPSMDNDA